jgi:N-methylhydantoinase B
VVRVVTTGGGGWGDPLQRELEFVLRDLTQGRVSRASAEADYGVVFATASAEDQLRIDEAATRQRRADIEKARTTPHAMIDRGEGYEKMLRGEQRPRTR